MSVHQPHAASPLEQAQQSLEKLLARYRTEQTSTAAIADHASLEQLQALSKRLTSQTLRIAVFGLVSRGKSAVINAVLGEPILETGPLHGVTRWPRSVLWQPDDWPKTQAKATDSDGDSWPKQIEFIDTPGLDEIAGEERASMALTVAAEADLILFVVAGEITEPEYSALASLQKSDKPLLLVFNKADLYPDIDPQAIHDRLKLSPQFESTASNQPYVSGIDAVVQIAAAPTPIQVRTEWPDGSISYTWESPPPSIEPLRQALMVLLRQDGATLIALNVLRVAQQLEAHTIQAVTQQQSSGSDKLLRRYAQYKALAIALNPLGIVDLGLNVAADLILIRNLSRLYGFPITNHGVSELWRSVLRGSGLLLLGEAGSLIVGGSPGLDEGLSSLGTSGFIPLLSGLALQAGLAAYSTYTVGKAAQQYLEKGYTWSAEGISTTTQTVLATTRSTPLLSRLRQSLQAALEKPSVQNLVAQATSEHGENIASEEVTTSAPGTPVIPEA